VIGRLVSGLCCHLLALPLALHQSALQALALDVTAPVLASRPAHPAGVISYLWQLRGKLWLLRPLMQGLQLGRVCRGAGLQIPKGGRWVAKGLQ